MSGEVSSRLRAAVSSAPGTMATPPAAANVVSVVPAPGDEPLATIARRFLDACTAQSRKPGDSTAVWDLVHLLGVICTLEVQGHRDAVLEAMAHHGQTYKVNLQLPAPPPSDGQSSFVIYAGHRRIGNNR